MNTVDHDWVQEARPRLDAVGSSATGDPALRVLELDSPRPDEAPLRLHKAFCVIGGLSESARHALAATVDGIRTSNANIGLAGTVESFGRRVPIHTLRVSDRTPGTALVPAAAIFGRTSARTAEAALLAEVIETIGQAVLLSGAELRGADAAATAVTNRLRGLSPEHADKLGTSIEIHDGDKAEDRAALAALGEIAPDPMAVRRIEEALDLLRSDNVRTRLQAACSQAAASKAQLLPSDARDVAMLADLAVAEAQGCLAEYDMTPGSPAESLTAQLAQISVDAAAFNAPSIAERIISESAELESIRARLVRSIAAANPFPEVAFLSDERRRIDEQRLHIQRRLRSQQQLLAIAREQWGRIGLGEVDLRSTIDLSDDADRPPPILVEDPLNGLPARLSGAILSTLLRHSSQTQVLCVSDQIDLKQWCASVGDRADWVPATGWFAGRHELAATAD
ncbi:MAG: hypothetical protein ACI81L_003173 [Verrucomicrobiales bacterium]